MGQRSKNNYLTLIATESPFGVQKKTGYFTLPLTCVPQEFTNSIEAKQNTATLEPMGVEILAGTKGGTVNINGALVTNVVNMDILPKLALHAPTSPLRFQSTNTPLSATIYRYDLSNNTMDVAIGCVCQNMKISGSQGGLVNIDASFTAVSILRDVSDAGVAAPTVPLLTATRFQDCTISAGDGQLVKMTSFEFNVNNTYSDDEYRYQNSETVTAEGVCKGNATLNAGFIYDTSSSVKFFGNLVGTVKEDTIVIGDWSLVTNGKYIEFDNPDGECVFKGSFVKDCRREGPNYAVSLTI